MFSKLFVKKNIEDKFWDWFTSKSNLYYNFEKNQNFLFVELKNKLNKIHPDLVFEFGPILKNGKREFVISADGIKSSFPFVKKLVDKAPHFQNWKIVAFRQPKEGIDQIIYKNLRFHFDDVFFRFGKDSGKISLELNIRDYNENPNWTGATFVLLDNLIGEYYAETAISKIEKIKLKEQEIKNLFPIIMLPQILKEYYSEYNN